MTSCEFDANAPSAHVPLVARCGNGSINMRQGNILNEATAVSPATFLGEAIRLVIQIVVRQGWASCSGLGSGHNRASDGLAGKGELKDV